MNTAVILQSWMVNMIESVLPEAVVLQSPEAAVQAGEAAGVGSIGVLLGSMAMAVSVAKICELVAVETIKACCVDVVKIGAGCEVAGCVVDPDGLQATRVNNNAIIRMCFIFSFSYAQSRMDPGWQPLLRFFFVGTSPINC